MARTIKKTITKSRKIGDDEYSDTDLCTRFQKGDLPAFTELAKVYSRLVATVAAKYTGKQLPKSELILYAKIGLLKAAHRYDESKMVSFRLYAIWWMRQVVLKALNEQTRIEQIPEMLIQNMHELMESFKQNRDKLNPDTGYIKVAETVEEEISEIKKFMTKRNKLPE